MTGDGLSPILPRFSLIAPTFNSFEFPRGSLLFIGFMSRVLDNRYLRMVLEFIASIAGLVSLAGLFVQSTPSLYVPRSGFPKTAGEIDNIVQEIRSLENVSRGNREPHGKKKPPNESHTPALFHYEWKKKFKHVPNILQSGCLQ